MSDQAYAKVQAQQKPLMGSSPKSSLLQHTCACGQHAIAGNQCPTCRDSQSTLLRSQKALGFPPTSTSSQENVSPVNGRIPRFGHDFSQIPVYASHTLVLQTKLTVNQPGDVYEQEADQVAEQVMRMADSESSVPNDEDETKNSLRKQSSQTEAVTDTHSVPPIVHDVLSSGGGQPLDTTTRAFMEPRFGHDFSQVRVHSDERAAKSAQAVSALAYTVGRNIVFGTGQYTPGTSTGRKLLAHELTHIVQQRKQNNIPDKLYLGAYNDALEREANSVSNTITATASDLHQKATGTDSIMPKEEPLAQNAEEGLTANSGNTQMTIAQHCPVSLLGSPILQRTAKFVPGKVSANRNAAYGIRDKYYMGATYLILNGKGLVGPTPAETKAAIHKPRLVRELDPAGGVKCRINTVPTNVGTTLEVVLTGGPWRLTTTKAELVERLKLPDCGKPGRATYTVHGIPSEVAVAAANKKHEDQHARDMETAFNEVVVPWDQAMTSAQTSKQTFHGVDQTDCEKTLFAALGGMPDEIATKLANSVVSKAEEFHHSDAGSNLTRSDARWVPNKDCQEAEANLSEAGVINAFPHEKVPEQK